MIKAIAAALLFSFAVVTVKAEPIENKLNVSVNEYRRTMSDAFMEAYKGFGADKRIAASIKATCGPGHEVDKEIFEARIKSEFKELVDLAVGVLIEYGAATEQDPKTLVNYTSTISFSLFQQLGAYEVGYLDALELIGESSLGPKVDAMLCAAMTGDETLRDNLDEENSSDWGRIGRAIQAQGAAISRDNKPYSNTQPAYQRQESQRLCEDAIRRERSGAANSIHFVNEACDY